MVEKLIVTIMGPGKKHFAELCLESVKDADKILYYTSNYLAVKSYFVDNELYKSGKLKIRFNGWDEEDKATNGKARNLYLKELKEEYLGWICLCLDEDEILSDGGINKIKEFINEKRKQSK